MTQIRKQYKRLCQFCNNPFISYKKFGKYCSQKCNEKAWTLINRAPNPVLKEKLICSLCKKRATGFLKTVPYCTFHYQIKRMEKHNYA